ncbi:hypothetical protein GCM10007301_00570 [Azorhizobium oxalatiphilum]|uniref:Secreted protein n=1 Tax=Azorhizobium oxalatiphilum TaxID=980631 RepID=A0A917F1X9_9HYPH|nr:hypothetical protein [Azorhizobium oxalatiphilum]GGF44956.1 hypothetical protein GCM10007301_00570 [Azorhizobium oxalatiphilum]
MRILRLILLTSILGLSSVSMANAFTFNFGFIEISFGGGGGGHGGGHGGSHGAPAPIAAAGLPLLAAFGFYRAMKWQRRR